MEPNFGGDSYALRSCLSEPAFDVVSGVDDDYDEMWVRLKTKYGDTERLVDTVLNDSAKLLALVDTVEHCWLDLRKVNLEREMDTSTTVTMIERLLPRTQRRKWTLFKQAKLQVNLNY